jgi:DNA-binding beta-propeller fold protein YncE
MADGKAPLRLVQTVPMPNVAGRFDHLTVDIKGGRLFLAAITNNTVEVLDLSAGTHIRTMNGFGKPQGILYVPALNRLFVASLTDGTLKAFRGDSLELLETVQLSPGADIAGYDPAAGLLYIGHGGKDAGESYGELTAIDARKGKRVADMRLAAHPGGFAVEEHGPRMFLTISQANQVAVVDRKKWELSATWPVTGVTAAVDEANRRLFVAARKPPSVIVLDSRSGRVVANLAGGDEPQGIFFDVARRQIYVSCGEGEGFISVYRQLDADHYEALPRIPTAPDARTSVWVPELNRLYLAVPRQGDREAEVRAYEAEP